MLPPLCWCAEKEVESIRTPPSKQQCSKKGRSLLDIQPGTSTNCCVERGSYRMMCSAFVDHCMDAFLYIATQNKMYIQKILAFFLWCEEEVDESRKQGFPILHTRWKMGFLQ
jgi:hypothetical protein